MRWSTFLSPFATRHQPIFLFCSRRPQDVCPVLPADMVGVWQGEGIRSGHPPDGVLENLGSFGRRFQWHRYAPSINSGNFCQGLRFIEPLNNPDTSMMETRRRQSKRPDRTRERLEAPAKKARHGEKHSKARVRTIKPPSRSSVGMLLASKSPSAASSLRHHGRTAEAAVAPGSDNGPSPQVAD